MTSRRPQTNQLEIKKNKLKDGANIEINKKYLDEIVHKNYLKMDSAIQIIANDKTVRNDTLLDLKEFNNQSLATEAKKRRPGSFDVACQFKSFFTTGR